MLDEILSLLPPRAVGEILKYREDAICEIRLHSGRPMTVTSTKANIHCLTVCTEEEISETVFKMCGGSLHSFSETLKNGYIPLKNGCRVGVSGTMSGGYVRDITSLCIRIPRTVRSVGASLCRRLTSSRKGMLIYSPPGEGKTTLLRDIASSLSSPPNCLRVSVIDTRNEIFREDAFERSAADIYIAYPKAIGIELATRTMSPQYIICDELGSEEAASVLSAQNCGVPLVATAHAPSLDALLKRKAFRELDSAGVFGFYVGIRRENDGYIFNITERKTDT